LGAGQPDSVPLIVIGGPRAQGLAAGYTPDVADDLAKTASRQDIPE
jgi:hypothetical protein